MKLNYIKYSRLILLNIEYNGSSVWLNQYKLIIKKILLVFCNHRIVDMPQEKKSTIIL